MISGNFPPLSLSIQSTCRLMDRDVRLGPFGEQLWIELWQSQSRPCHPVALLQRRRRGVPATVARGAARVEGEQSRGVTGGIASRQSSQ